MSESAYRILGLKHYYKNYLALDIDELSLAASSVTGIIGPNGSGKSTLLKLLAFIETPSKGTILFKGQPAKPFSPLVRFKVSLLAQEPYLLKRTVFENIAYGIKLRGNTKDNCQKIVHESLNLVGLSPHEFASRQWYQLSGGEAQRAALAARLALKPEVLLLDEPTASVDAASAQQIKETSIKACREWGTTLIIASHDWQWLYEICDDMIHVFKGKLLGKKAENIIFGLWEPETDERWGKRLHDGQRMIVARPPSPNAAAILSQDSIHMNVQPPKAHPGEYILHGVISRLTMEKSSSQIIANIRISNLSLTVKLSQAQVQELNLFPGRDVWVTYSPFAIRWH